MPIKLLIILILSQALSGSGISIKMYPQQLMKGEGTWLTCRVTPDLKNKALEYGLTDYTSSTRELDGYDAPITWGPYLYKAVPCYVSEGYCLITHNDGSFDRASTKLIVSGCDE